MAMNTIGTLTEFKPESDKIEAYLERVQCLSMPMEPRTISK